MSIHAEKIIEQSERLYKKQWKFTKKILIVNTIALCVSLGIFIFMSVKGF